MRATLSIVLLCLLLTLQTLAQNPRFAGTPAEESALRHTESYDHDDLVKAREEAHQILKENPQSYAGHYVMGYTLHNSEGDLPQAKFHMQKALDLFLKKHGNDFSIDSPWGWYERALMEMVQINAEMDLYQEQVDTLDTYQKLSMRLFNVEAPSILVSYAWPLMKLEKEREARSKLEKVSYYHDEGTRTTYLNTLGALEMEFGHPQASYSAFKTLIEEVRANGWNQTATYLRNLGEAAAGIGHLDEAERLYSEATRYFNPLTYSNPWFDLAFMYVSQARFPEAVSALQKTHQWRFSVRPFLAQQTWAQDLHVSAELLMHLGETDKALEIAEMITQRPDRQGGDSIQRDQKEAGTYMLYRALCLAEASRLKESLSWKSGWQWWKALAYRRKLLNDARFAAIKVRSLASNHERLASSLRPYYAPGTDPIWSKCMGPAWPPRPSTKSTKSRRKASKSSGPLWRSCERRSPGLEGTRMKPSRFSKRRFPKSAKLARSCEPERKLDWLESCSTRVASTKPWSTAQECWTRRLPCSDI